MIKIFEKDLLSLLAHLDQCLELPAEKQKKEDLDLITQKLNPIKNKLAIFDEVTKKRYEPQLKKILEKLNLLRNMHETYKCSIKANLNQMNQSQKAHQAYRKSTLL